MVTRSIISRVRSGCAYCPGTRRVAGAVARPVGSRERVDDIRPVSDRRTRAAAGRSTVRRRNDLGTRRAFAALPVVMAFLVTACAGPAASPAAQPTVGATQTAAATVTATEPAASPAASPAESPAGSPAESPAGSP